MVVVGEIADTLNQANVFIAKYDPSGQLLWEKYVNVPEFQLAEDVAIDATGNVAVVGTFVGSIDFGGGPLETYGAGADVFVVKFDPAGTHLWSRRFGELGSHGALQVAADSAGDVVLLVQSNGSVDFGGGALDAGGIYMAKLDATGDHVWRSELVGLTGPGLAIDAEDDILIAGEVPYGSVDFGGGPLQGSLRYRPGEARPAR